MLWCECFAFLAFCVFFFGFCLHTHKWILCSPKIIFYAKVGKLAAHAHHLHTLTYIHRKVCVLSNLMRCFLYAICVCLLLFISGCWLVVAFVFVFCQHQPQRNVSLNIVLIVPPSCCKAHCQDIFGFTKHLTELRSKRPKYSGILLDPSFLLSCKMDFIWLYV